MRTVSKLRRVRTSLGFLLLFIPFLTAPLLAGDGDEAGYLSRIRNDIRYLASDELEGRAVGSKGLRQAAEFVRDEFRKAGLKPGMPDGEYFQSFHLPAGGVAARGTWTLTGPAGVTKELSANRQFIPLVFSGRAEVSAPLVFVGYGISAPEYDYDDYAGMDVTGKVLLMMRHEPHYDDTSPDAPFDGKANSRHALFSTKMDLAVAHRAAAVVFVTNPKLVAKSNDRLLRTAQSPKSYPIPVIHVIQAVANELLTASIGTDLETIERQIDEQLKPRSRVLEGWSLAGAITRRPGVRLQNVIGVLDGAGPHADETIVIGGHYDHVGYGDFGSLAGVREIHNGADDNASGTVGVLELARRLASRPNPLPRRFVFIAFTAEEIGLRGSAYYVTRPAIPLDKTVAMLNMDMIGRLRGRLMIYGAATAPEFRGIIKSAAQDAPFKVRLFGGSSGRSDEASFLARKIPALHFFTGTHADYHAPGDDWEKISIDGTNAVINLVEAVGLELANLEDRPHYAVAQGASIVSGGKARPSLGVAIEQREAGVVIGRVAPGGPAERSGVMPGDVVKQLGDDTVTSVAQWYQALDKHKPGEKLELTVQREGSDMKLEATLTSAGPTSQSPARTERAYLGTIPDLDETPEGGGVLLQGAAEGGPAYQAGIREGDIITRLNETAIASLDDLQGALESCKPGQVVKITVRRGSTTNTYDVTLGAR